MKPKTAFGSPQPPMAARPALFVLLALLASPLVETLVSGGDWPQFLGPLRNGTATDTNVAREWPKDGPPVVWRKKIGAGFAGPVVSNGRLFLFHRVGDQEVVDCFDARTGRDEWQSGYPTHYRDDFGFDEGPRGTPTVVSNRVYTYGAEGMLGCWDASDGRKVWSADTKSQFRQSKGFFGMACSPLIEGDLVVLNVGGKGGAGLVAFDRSTGKVRWKASDDEASYASPVAATVAGSRRVFAITREALISVNPLDGSVAFRYPWRPSMDASVSAATPLVIDDQIFISASYGTGATLLRLRGNRPEKVWSSDESLSNHYATSVHRDGLLFGFDGRQEHGCDLRCVELQSGKVRWSEGGLGAGTVTLAGDRLLVLTEKGELIQAPATSTGFKPSARAQILPFGARAHPALAEGRFYARSKDQLHCVDLTQKP